MLAGLKRMTDERADRLPGRIWSKAGALRSILSTAWWHAKGQEVGIPAPTHAGLTDLVKRVERGEIEPTPEAIANRIMHRRDAQLDSVIRGGQVVTPAGVGSWDIGIRGEKIVAIAEQGILTENVGRIIDARGKIAVPGGIEPHAHVAAPIMGHAGMETAPPDQVSRAAPVWRHYHFGRLCHSVPRARYLCCY